MALKRLFKIVLDLPKLTLSSFSDAKTKLIKYRRIEQNYFLSMSEHDFEFKLL